MIFKKHKSSKDVPPAKTKRIEPPSPQSKVTVDKYGTREFHCEPPKGSKPKPPRRQYGTNFIPPTNIPPPEAPPNQYGSVGSIDNSELNILLIDKKDLPKWADELTTGNVSEMRNIKGVNKMEEYNNGVKTEYKETKYQYNFKCTFKNGRDINKTFTVDHKIESETFDGIMNGKGDKLVFKSDNMVLIIDKQSIETLLIKCVEEN